MTQTQILFDIYQNDCLMAAVVLEYCVVHISADRCYGACMAPALMLCVLRLAVLLRGAAAQNGVPEPGACAV